jgi:hypothetical protein
MEAIDKTVTANVQTNSMYPFLGRIDRRLIGSVMIEPYLKMNLVQTIKLAEGSQRQN